MGTDSARGLPRRDFGKAVRYMLERWQTLQVFLDNPLVPLDNNHAERALRGGYDDGCAGLGISDSSAE